MKKFNDKILIVDDDAQALHIRDMIVSSKARISLPVLPRIKF